MNNIFKEIKKERERQDQLWGKQNHEPLLWLSILMEEVGEASKEISDSLTDNNIDDTYTQRQKERYSRYREELIQVAAVTVQMIENFDKNIKI